MKDRVRNVAVLLTERPCSPKLYHPILNFSIQISERGRARRILQAEARIAKTGGIESLVIGH
jgi:hypothetical protein